MGEVVMKRIALNFICKNEGHIINEMLTSALPLTDLIVAVDTGSTDNTIKLIHAFGEKNNIPTFVFERPFDNFCNSRNYALDRLKEVVRELQWPPELTWGAYIDCDELIEFTGKFSRQSILNDIYYTCHTDRKFLDSRQFLFNLSKDFRWEGPIHEFIEYRDTGISQGYLENVRTIFRRLGASWKGDIEKKYLNYAKKLVQYVNEGNMTFRWLYYSGECFSAAADASKSKQKKQELLQQALSYYEKASEIDGKKRYQKYIVYFRIAEAKLSQGREPNEIREPLLKAYAADRRHAEPLYELIKIYIKKGQWETAYLFSCFAVKNYHEKLPMANDMGDVMVSIYKWELIFYHILICSNSGRIGESKRYYLQLRAILQAHKVKFDMQELILIKLVLWQNRFIRIWPKLAGRTDRIEPDEVPTHGEIVADTV